MKKKKVIIILDKSEQFSDLVNEKIEKWFPEKYYEVDVYSRESFRHMNVNYIWMKERLPIVIGSGDGAVYLEDVKNYSRKYLISGFWNDNIGNSMFYDIDEYDRKNTYCLFGSNSMSLEMAEIYGKHYPKTLSGLCDGKLDIVEGIEYCGISNLFTLEGETMKKDFNRNI